MIALIYDLVLILGTVALFVAIGAASRRTWVQVLVAGTLFIMSTGASVWVLQLGWVLAAVGILLLISGTAWKLLSKASQPTSELQRARAHPSGGLLWPGLALLAAPFANVFLLMPLLRQILH